MIIKKHIAALLILSAALPFGASTAFADNASVAGLTPEMQAKIQTMSCDPFKHTLHKGDTDAATDGEVTRLQTLLTLDAKNTGNVSVNGMFDEATEQALMRTQKDNTASFEVKNPSTQAALQPDPPGVFGAYTSAQVTILCTILKNTPQMANAVPLPTPDATPLAQPTADAAPVLPQPMADGAPPISLPNGTDGKKFRIPGTLALSSNERATAVANAMQIMLTRNDQSCGTVEVVNGAAPPVSMPLQEGETVVSAPQGSLKIICALNTASSTAGYVVFDLPDGPTQF